MPGYNFRLATTCLQSSSSPANVAVSTISPRPSALAPMSRDILDDLELAKAAADAAGMKRPEPAVAASPDDDSVAVDSPAGEEATQDRAQAVGLSLHQQRRRRKIRHIVLALLLTASFVVTVMWSSGTFDETKSETVLSIAPSVLFEQQCDEIRKDGLNKLHVSEYEVDDAMIESIGDLETLETLILDRGVVTDTSMATIASLPKLQHLRLRLSPINDEGFKQLSKCESLWYVNLPHAACTAQGVAELAAIPKLRQLRLGSSRLGNEVTREIASIESLRGVHLIGVAVTDEGLKTLAAMPHLESLYMDDSAVTEAGWDWLFREHPHLHVHINQDHHDRDPKAHQHRN